MKYIIKGFSAAVKGSRVWKGVLALEFIILFFLLGNCFRGRCDYEFDAETLNVSGDDYVQYLTKDGELAGFTASLDENIEETTIAYTDDFRLYPGAYRISLQYASQVNYDTGVSSLNGNGYLYLESENNSAYFYFDSVFLKNSTEQIDQTVQIRSLFCIDDLSLRVTYYGLGELTVYSVEVTEILAYRYICFLGLLLIFLIFDAVVYLVFTDTAFRYHKELAVLVIICAAAILPFLADYTFVGSGHDTGFHINRIRSLAQELSNGNYFPAIYSYAANGYGYAAPLFYGQLFLYIPAILFNCGFSLTFVYNLYLGIMSIAACLVMYGCALKIIHNRDSALMAAAMYTFGGPRLTAVFTRGALGDITAQVFFPLIVLGLYRVYSSEKGDKITIRQYWPIIVGLTGVAVSHALSTVMCAILIVLVCVVFFRKTFEKQRFAALAKAAVLTVLVNLAVFIPMLDSMRMDLVLTGSGGSYIQTHGAYLLQILNAVSSNHDLSSEAGTASGDLSMSLGFATVTGLILFVICAVKNNQEGIRHTEKKQNGFALTCWCLSVFTLFLSTVYMCYDYLDFLPSSVFSALTSLQFPWRWLSYASLFGVFCTASVLERAKKQAVFGKVPAALVLSMALIINTGQVYSDALKEINLVRYSDSDSMNIGGGGEYLPAQTDIGQLYYRDLIYDEAALSIGDYSFENGGYFIEVENASALTGTIDIPLLHYDNYVAYDAQTGESILITGGSNNRIQLNIPAGYSGTVAVEYQIPALWKMAVAVSVLTDVLLIAYVISRRRKKTRMILEEKQK